MATSHVELFNSALRTLGQNPILSFEEDSKAGRFAKDRYFTLLDSLLRRHNWQFAITRKALPPDNDSPLYEYQYKFTFPVELVRLISISPDIDYKIEGRSILCNSNAIYIRYVYRAQNPTLYSSSFCEAFISLLAHELALNLTGSPDIAKFQFDKYKLLIAEARFFDASEEPADRIEAEEWIDSRR